jgi:hypothetical protein
VKFEVVKKRTTKKGGLKQKAFSSGFRTGGETTDEEIEK